VCRDAQYEGTSLGKFENTNLVIFLKTHPT